MFVCDRAVDGRSHTDSPGPAPGGSRRPAEGAAHHQFEVGGPWPQSDHADALYAIGYDNIVFPGVYTIIVRRHAMIRVTQRLQLDIGPFTSHPGNAHALDRHPIGREVRPVDLLPLVKMQTANVPLLEARVCEGQASQRPPPRCCSPGSGSGRCTKPWIGAVDHDVWLFSSKYSCQCDHAHLTDAIAGVWPPLVHVHACLSIAHEGLHERRERWDVSSVDDKASWISWEPRNLPAALATLTMRGDVSDLRRSGSMACVTARVP